MELWIDNLCFTSLCEDATLHCCYRRKQLGCYTLSLKLGCDGKGLRRQCFKNTVDLFFGTD
jgi:hypothetical protein